jgi:hypothetical protein
VALFPLASLSLANLPPILGLLIDTVGIDTEPTLALRKVVESLAVFLLRPPPLPVVDFLVAFIVSFPK